jgi:hypothetical protein
MWNYHETQVRQVIWPWISRIYAIKNSGFWLKLVTLYRDRAISFDYKANDYCNASQRMTRFTMEVLAPSVLAL